MVMEIICLFVWLSVYGKFQSSSYIVHCIFKSDMVQGEFYVFFVCTLHYVEQKDNLKKSFVKKKHNF